MGLGGFYWECLKRAFRGKFWFAEKWAGLLGMVVGGGIAILQPVGSSEMTWVNWLPLAIFGAVFLATAFVGLVLAPWQIFREADERAETNKRTFLAEIAQHSRPVFSIVQERDRKYLRIDNKGVDAEFTAKISFPDTTTHAFPNNPVNAQWFDYSKDTSRFIQSGGYDRIILFSIDMKANVFLKTLVFAWISDGHQFERNSTSWAVTQNSGTIPPSGEMEVFISSEPPMQGGSKVLRLGYEGDKISVIKGEVQLPQ